MLVITKVILFSQYHQECFQVHYCDTLQTACEKVYHKIKQMKEASVSLNADRRPISCKGTEYPLKRDQNGEASLLQANPLPGKICAQMYGCQLTVVRRKCCQLFLFVLLTRGTTSSTLSMRLLLPRPTFGSELNLKFEKTDNWLLDRIIAVYFFSCNTKSIMT